MITAHRTRQRSAGKSRRMAALVVGLAALSLAVGTAAPASADTYWRELGNINSGQCLSVLLETLPGWVCWTRLVHQLGPTGDSHW